MRSAGSYVTRTIGKSKLYFKGRSRHWKPSWGTMDPTRFCTWGCVSQRSDKGDWRPFKWDHCERWQPPRLAASDKTRTHLINIFSSEICETGVVQGISADCDGGPLGTDR